MKVWIYLENIFSHFGIDYMAKYGKNTFHYGCHCECCMPPGKRIKQEIEIAIEEIKKFIANQEPIPEEFEKTFRKNYRKLLAKL